jgi:hypothetical protein
MTPSFISKASLFAFTCLCFQTNAQTQKIPAYLPGELSADQVLNGEYPFPASPPSPFTNLDSGLEVKRLGQTPPPGVHPRILISPEELPDLRRRLKETESGRQILATMKDRIHDTLAKPGWSSELYQLLAAGDLKALEAGLDQHKGEFPGVGHYQPYLMAMTLEALRCLIEEDKTAGTRLAAALDTYCRFMEPYLDRFEKTALNDDVWRMGIPNRDKTKWRENIGGRDITGYHLLGYVYDFGYPFMSDPQRANVRRLISKATKGKVWMGARLPHHFRDWNWVAIGTQTPLMALAIEGEEGYDPRVYKLGVEIARDYLTYAISPSGASTEAVGYTQFGLNWLNPFVVAATRRGEKLLTHSHFRNMLDWYIQSMAPAGARWISHGDGGDGSPSPSTLSMWKYFLPNDPKAGYLWQNFVQSTKNKPFDGRPHMVEAVLWASDPKPMEYQAGAVLNLPLTWFDPVRSSLISRDAWKADATSIEFECRTDSFSASHEHADRGHFTLTADGRDWSKDNFRSVETRHHSCILVDGKGQGFWPGPGKWIGLAEKGSVLIAACDAKDAYDGMWPKQAETEPKDYYRYQFERWKDYAQASDKFRQRMEGLKGERDLRPSIRAVWEPYFDKGGGPHLWDEDTWPIRFTFNPVLRAFRTLVFARGPKPYLLVVDDFQKDNQERLYEWLLQTGENTEMTSFKDNDIILCDATVKRDDKGQVKPQKGDRQLLVRILNMNDPKLERDYQTRPSVRLETFDRRDTLTPVMEAGKLSGGRTFGLDKRLVVASRSVAPDYQILLFPHKNGDPLPETVFDETHTKLTIKGPGLNDELRFTRNPDGRTRVVVQRDGQTVQLP